MDPRKPISFVDGIAHFELPSKQKFAMRKPKFSHLKQAAQLAGAGTGSEHADQLIMGEHFALLLLCEVNGQPVNYQGLIAAGGLEGAFPELLDCLEVTRIAQDLVNGGAAAPLALSSSAGTQLPPT